MLALMTDTGATILHTRSLLALGGKQLSYECATQLGLFVVRIQRHHVDDERLEAREGLGCAKCVDFVPWSDAVQALQSSRTRCSTRQGLPADDEGLDVRVPASRAIDVCYGDDLVLYV